MPRTDRLTDAHEQLVVAVTTLTTTTRGWRQFLDVARRFHRYSLNNVLLIAAQRPDATRVAGYRAWQQLGRQVRKGEHGIAILAPCTYRTSSHDEDSNDDRGDGEQRVLRGFKVVHVFDIAQTEGDPLPSPPVQLLDGETPAQLLDRLRDLIVAAGYTFALGAMPAGHEDSLGVSDHTARAVIVRDDLPSAQRAKTAAHELAHVLLHPLGSERPRREVCEIEAESVAYLVCGEAGLTTDAYSLGYVATWAAGDIDLIRATGGRVLRCARQILDGLPQSAITDADRAQHDNDDRRAA